MKRIICVLCLSLLLSSMISAEDKMLSREPVFQPPEWILGTWTDLLAMMNYEFRSNDVLLGYGDQGVSFGKMLPPEEITIEECSDSTYEFSVPSTDGRVHYLFSLSTPGSMMLKLQSDTLIGPVMLFKEEK